MNKRSYDRSESILVDGKDFHFTPDRKEFLAELTSKFPDKTSFTKEDFDKLSHVPYWVKHPRYNFKQGSIFNLQPVLGNVVQMRQPSVPVTPPASVLQPAPVSQNMPVAAATESVNLMDDNVKIVPEKMSNYVPFGHFKDVKNIIKSKIFFPVFITGLSGMVKP